MARSSVVTRSVVVLLASPLALAALMLAATWIGVAAFAPPAAARHRRRRWSTSRRTWSRSRGVSARWRLRCERHAAALQRARSRGHRGGLALSQGGGGLVARPCSRRPLAVPLLRGPRRPGGPRQFVATSLSSARRPGASSPSPTGGMGRGIFRGSELFSTENGGSVPARRPFCPESDGPNGRFLWKTALTPSRSL